MAKNCRVTTCRNVTSDFSNQACITKRQTTRYHPCFLIVWYLKVTFALELHFL
eukprot:m.95069 g.95069  ORF g.95069 m.95069 type:complete len:53 (+) comp13038_c0_seq3:375-533(+)